MTYRAIWLLALLAQGSAFAEEQSTEERRYHAYAEDSGFAIANREWLNKSLDLVLDRLVTHVYALGPVNKGNLVAKRVEVNACFLRLSEADEKYYDGLSLSYFDSGDAEYALYNLQGLRTLKTPEERKVAHFADVVDRIRTNIAQCIDVELSGQHVTWETGERGIFGATQVGVSKLSTQRAGTDEGSIIQATGESSKPDSTRAVDANSLLKNADISGPLRKLLGPEFGHLMQNVQQDSVVRSDGNLYIAYGCSRQNCASETAAFSVDTLSHTTMAIVWGAAPVPKVFGISETSEVSIELAQWFNKETARRKEL